MGIATRRPRISRAFVETSHRGRILDGLARLVIAQGFRVTTVADITKETGCARNTFYDVFSGKDAAGGALLHAAFPSFDPAPAAEDLASDSRLVLAAEVAALLRVGRVDDAKVRLDEAGRILDLLRERIAQVEPMSVDGDLSAALPPGRHGLPRDFVLDNQRTRLLQGTALAIADRGMNRTAVIEIVANAAVSRRTFYEHFEGVADAGRRLLLHLDERLACDPSVGDVTSGTGSLCVEALATAWVGRRGGPRDGRGPGADRGGPVSITKTYTRLHAAIREEAKRAGVGKLAVRLALAAHDRGGSATTDELAEDLLEIDSVIRRGALAVYSKKLATGHGIDGGPRRPGIRSVVELTDAGQAMCARILDAARVPA